MRNAPYIPLWGVVSKHPTVVECSRQEPEVRDFLPPVVLRRCATAPTEGGTLITCPCPTDVSEVIECMRANTCTVLKQQPILVATPDEKVEGTEHFFGTNALGALPTCTVHTNVKERDLHCLSNVDDRGNRKLRCMQGGMYAGMFGNGCIRQVQSG